MTKFQEVFRGAVKSALWCAAVGVALFWLIEKYGGFDVFTEKEFLPVARSLGGAISQISITLAGFVLTSTAIFAAFGDKPLVQAMYESHHAHALIARMYIAIAFNIVSCAAAVWVTITPELTTTMFMGLLGMAGACIASLVNVLHKLWYVLVHVNGQGRDQHYEDIDGTIKSVGEP